MPDFELEDACDCPVIGIDEVGRGPLAGPVVAAAVHIPRDIRDLEFIVDIKDSKKLSRPKLEALYALITEYCQWAVAEVSVDEIDRINILQASMKAMREAFEELDPRFHKGSTCLVDGNRLPDLPCSAQTVVKGDHKSYSIAAASIVAKVTRDRLMCALHEDYPHYGWDTNVGYGSAAHLEGINQHGLTAHHRQSFAPVKNFLMYGSTRAPLKTAG